MRIYPTYQDYRNAWKCAVLDTPRVPLNIDLELVPSCNLKCPHCYFSDPSFLAVKGAKIMTRELAFYIIDQCADIGVPALKFNWRGESTLHPDYYDILYHAFKKTTPLDTGLEIEIYESSFLDTLVNTNGNCPIKSIGALMFASKVMFSLDSLVPETYAVMRRGGYLEKVCQTIKALTQLGHQNVWVRRVITKLNKHEPFTKMVKDLWQDKVKVSEHYAFDRTPENFEITPHGNYERTYCEYPSQRLVISWDGNVYPCCVDINQTMPLGNVKKIPLKKIWHGISLSTLRNELKCGVLTSEACRNCVSWMSYKAPEREYVNDVENKNYGE